MSHRAAVYTVKVRQKRDTSGEFRLLGDFDEQGTSLTTVLQGYLDDFESISGDESKVVKCTESKIENDELLVIMQNGQSGVAADIVNPDGDLLHRQEPEHTQLLRCGGLFRLPPAQKLGWLAIHVNNGRGSKGLLEKGIREQFGHEYPDLVLELTPYVQGSVLKEAVDQGRIDKVKLVKTERPNDRASAATDRWVPAGAIGRLELDISTPGKAARVLSTLVQRFLGGDHSAFDEIVEFEGITFDTAKVEVVLDGETRRTFNIEKPDAGHPFTEDMQNLTIENGEPTSASLFDGLRSALGRVST
jgi:hypothetical protein